MGLPWAPNICQVLVSPPPTIHMCQPVLASRQADGGAGFTPPPTFSCLFRPPTNGWVLQIRIGSQR